MGLGYFHGIIPWQIDNKALHRHSYYLSQRFQLHPRLSTYDERTTEVVYISRGIPSKVVQATTVRLGAYFGIEC